MKWPLFLAPLVGCTLVDDNEDTTDPTDVVDTMTTPDQPDPGTTPEDPTPTDVEPVAVGDPTPQCLAYIDCLDQIDDDKAELAEAAFGEGSPCWADPLTAFECTVTCEAGSIVERDENPLADACWGEGMPRASLIFDEVPRAWLLDGGTGQCPSPYVYSTPFVSFLPRTGTDVDLDLLVGTIFIDTSCALAPDRSISCAKQLGFDIRASFSAGWDVLTVDLTNGSDIDCTYVATPDPY